MLKSSWWKNTVESKDPADSPMEISESWVIFCTNCDLIFIFFFIEVKGKGWATYSVVATPYVSLSVFPHLISYLSVSVTSHNAITWHSREPKRTTYTTARAPVIPFPFLPSQKALSLPLFSKNLETINKHHSILVLAAFPSLSYCYNSLSLQVCVLLLLFIIDDYWLINDYWFPVTVISFLTKHLQSLFLSRRTSLSLSLLNDLRSLRPLDLFQPQEYVFSFFFSQKNQKSRSGFRNLVFSFFTSRFSARGGSSDLKTFCYVSLLQFWGFWVPSLKCRLYKFHCRINEYEWRENLIIIIIIIVISHFKIDCCYLFRFKSTLPHNSFACGDLQSKMTNWIIHWLVLFVNHECKWIGMWRERKFDVEKVHLHVPENVFLALGEGKSSHRVRLGGCSQFCPCSKRSVTFLPNFLVKILKQYRLAR